MGKNVAAIFVIAIMAFVSCELPTGSGGDEDSDGSQLFSQEGLVITTSQEQNDDESYDAPMTLSFSKESGRVYKISKDEGDTWESVGKSMKLEKGEYSLLFKVDGKKISRSLYLEVVEPTDDDSDDGDDTDAEGETYTVSYSDKVVSTSTQYYLIMEKLASSDKKSSYIPVVWESTSKDQELENGDYAVMVRTSDGRWLGDPNFTDNNKFTASFEGKELTAFSPNKDGLRRAYVHLEDGVVTPY